MKLKNIQMQQLGKNDNNYVSTYEITCFPKVKLGDDTFHLSTQLAGLICQTDSLNEDIPYITGSNPTPNRKCALFKRWQRRHGLAPISKWRWRMLQRQT